MKKKFAIAFVLTVLFANVFTSCREKLKDVTGIVTAVDMTGDHAGDTIHTVRLYNGEDTLLFTVKDARYTNGIMLVGDSADISYISGHGDTLRALLVHVKPAPTKVINLETDTTKTLLTR